MVFLGCATTSTNIPETKSQDKPKVTYDGGIDPDVFNVWTHERAWKESQGITFAIKNPMKYATIPYALVYVAMGISKTHGIPDGSIVSFTYIDDGKLRYFHNVRMRGHYKEIPVPPNNTAILIEILKGLVGQ